MKYCVLILCCIVTTFCVKAQRLDSSHNSTESGKIRMLLYHSTSYQSDTTIHFLVDSAGVHTVFPSFILIGVQRNLCKQIYFVYKDTTRYVSAPSYAKANLQPTVVNKNKLVQIHGNVYYDVYYQSNIDTPFIERDVYQHTIRTNLEVTIKNHYPFRVAFTSRFSNSFLFKDFTGLGLQYNVRDFKNIVTARLQDYILNQLSSKLKMDSLDNLIRRKTNDLNALKNQMNDPSDLQQLIEANEKVYYESKLREQQNMVTGGQVKKITDSSAVNTFQFGLPNASEQKSVAQKFASKQFLDPREKDSTDTTKLQEAQSTIQSIKHKIAVARQNYDSVKKLIDTLRQDYNKAKASFASFQSRIAAAIKSNNPNAYLARTLDSLHLPDSVLPKGYKTLLAIRSVGIGRTMLNYSELSVKNVNITGLQIEYNPRYYFAIASGTVDYQFRDYIVNSNFGRKQYLNVLRVGKGQRDGNNVIFTFFQGKKQLFNYYNSVNGVVIPPDYKIFGYTVATHWQTSPGNYVELEAGKSTLPYFRRSRDKQNMFQGILNLKDHSNEAYSVKVGSYIDETNTRITAFYRKTGADYQSFSFFTTSSAQSAWSIKVDQPFFKNKIRLTGSVRKNDFSNPYLGNSTQSNIIFKSIQATIRIKKWPVVSAGYFPSSQLIKLGDQQFSENMFYMLTGNISHYYNYRNTRMNTLLNYTKFYNTQADSGFAYYNTTNILVSQLFSFSKTDVQATASKAMNNAYEITTFGGSVQVRVKKWLSLGGGLKHNYHSLMQVSQMGYTGNATIAIKALGTFQLYAEKAYMPGINAQLVKNNIGRCTYIKNF